MLAMYIGPQKKNKVPESKKNSKATGANCPRENLRAVSIDFIALFIAKTVFLADILWK